jgi:phosphate transport system substrate-binding protein
MWRLILILCLSYPLVGCAEQTPSPPPEPIELRLAAVPNLSSLAQELTQQFTQRQSYVTFELSVMAADATIQAVTERSVDAALIAQPLVDVLPNLEAVQVGRRAVAVVVHDSNPLEELTWEQVRDIYTGQVWDWAAVAPGQPSREIVVITQHAGAPSRNAFDRRVMNGQRITPRAIVATGDSLVLDLIAEEPAAIGYRLDGWDSPAVKALKIDGTAPSAAAVTSDQWPVTRPINLVSHVDANVYVLDFVDFAHGKQGQQLIRSTYGQ